MSKKKSYMDSGNILSEGIIQWIFKKLFVLPALKKNPAFKKALQNLNKDTEDFVKKANKLIAINNKKLKKMHGDDAPQTEPVKFIPTTMKDVKIKKGK